MADRRSDTVGLPTATHQVGRRHGSTRRINKRRYKGELSMKLSKTEVFYRVTVLVALVVLALDLIVWRPN